MRNFLYAMLIWGALNVCLTHVYGQEAPADISSFRRLTNQIDELKQKNNRADQIIIPRLERLLPKATFPYKNFLQSILADEYYAYYLSRLQMLRENPPRNIDPQNYRTWTAEILSDRIRELYLASLSPKKRLLETSTTDFKDLVITSKVAAVNQPNLYTILAGRALVFLQDQRGELHKGDLAFRIRSRQAFVEADSFISLNFRPLDTLSTAYLAVRLYQELLEVSKAYESPVSFIHFNIQRLKYARESSTGQLQRQRYADALQKMIEVYEKHPAIAEVKYELAKLYIERGQSYMPPGVKSFQWDYKAAYELCKEIIGEFPETQSAKKCKKLIEIIQQKTLSVDVEEVQIPHRPFRIKLNFRNVDRIYVRIVHLSQALDQSLESVEGDQEEQLDILRRESSIESWVQDLPNEQDFQMHAIELPMPELEMGKYILLIGDDPRLSTQNHAVLHARLRVSQIAVLQSYLNKGVHFRVVDRVNGQPIEGVEIRQIDRLEGGEKFLETDKEGSYTVDLSGGRKNYELTFKVGQDSIVKEARRRSSFSSSSKRLISRVYSDARVYRSGGTIHFRGLSYFHDGIPVSALTDSTMYVRMINAEEEIIRDTTVEINQYGSFSGSFRLPENETGHYMLIAQGGSYLFQIRDAEPEHFDLYLNIPEKDYDYWDSVVVNGKIIPFVGADMPETTIQYRVIRQSLFPYWYSDTWWRPELANERVLAARGKTSTDSTGDFQFSFSAIPDLELGVDEAVVYNYTIYVEATSLAGEAHHDTIEVRIGRPKLAVSVETAPVSEVGEPLALSIQTKDFFGRVLSMRGRLRIFPLEPPLNAYRVRQWSQPDMHVLDEASYHEMFPYDVYGYEDDFRSWKAEEAIVDTIIQTDSDNPIHITELTKHLAGKYRIRFDIKDADSMSLKVVEHITRYNSYASLPPIPTILDYSFSTLEARPGETVQLGLFTSEPNLWVFIESGTFDVVDTTWVLNMDNFIEGVSIPIKKAHKGDVFVRITTVIHNEFHTYTERIKVPWEERELDFAYTFKNENRISLVGKTNSEVELLPESMYLSFPHWRRFPYRFTPQNRSLRSTRSLGFSIARAGQISNNWRISLDNLLLPAEKYDWWADNKKVYASVKDLEKLDEEIWSNERTRMAQLNIQGGGGPSALIGIEHDLKARLQRQYISHLIAGPRLSEKIPRTYVVNSFYSSFIPNITGNAQEFSLSHLRFPLLGKWKIRTVAHDADLRTGVVELDTLIVKQLDADIRIPDVVLENTIWDCYLRIYHFGELDTTVDVAVSAQYYLQGEVVNEKKLTSQKLTLKADNGFKKFHYPISILKDVDSLSINVALIGTHNQMNKSFSVPIQKTTFSSTQSQAFYLAQKKKLKTYFEPLVNIPEDQLLSTKKYEVELTTTPENFAKPHLKELYHLSETDTRSIIQRIFSFHGLLHLDHGQKIPKDEAKDLLRLLKNRQHSSGLLSWQLGFKENEQLTVESLQILGWIEEWLSPQWYQQPLADSLIYPAIRVADSILIKQETHEESQNNFWAYLNMRALFPRVAFENEEMKSAFEELILEYQGKIAQLHIHGKLIYGLICANYGEKAIAKEMLAQISVEDALAEPNFLEIASLWVSLSYQVADQVDRNVWLNKVLAYLANHQTLTKTEQVFSSQVLLLSKNQAPELPAFKLKVGKQKVKNLAPNISSWKGGFNQDIYPKSSKIKLKTKLPQKIWGKITWVQSIDTENPRKENGYALRTEWVKEKSLLLLHIEAKKDLKHQVITYTCNPEIVPEASRKMIELEQNSIYVEALLKEVKLYINDLPTGLYTIEIPLLE